MQRDPATPDDIKDLIGDVDDMLIERILETSASPDEIAEAVRSLEAEDLAEKDFVPSSPRVTEVRSMLTALAEGEEEDDDSIFYYDDVHQSR